MECDDVIEQHCKMIKDKVCDQDCTTEYEEECTTSLEEQVGRSLQSDGMICELSTRNLNIIYLSRDNPRYVAYYLDNTETRDLGQEVVENIENDIGQGQGDWPVLVGYDGGVKMVIRDQAEWDVIFRTIDRMPMRRREILGGAVCP